MDDSFQDAKSTQALLEIQEITKRLQREEAEISKNLDWKIRNRHHVEAKLTNLVYLVPNLQLMQEDAKKMENIITFTNNLANTVSAKVRQLDLAKSRVSEVQKSVGDLLDIEVCAVEVSSALDSEDYEKAASHVSRFLSMDEDILRYSIPITNKKESFANWIDKLRSAEIQLKKIIRDKFDIAVAEMDVANIERFFKLFPLVNEHEEGIRLFGSYLCKNISKKNNENLLKAKQTKSSDKRSHIIWADTLTLLFEEIARIIEINQVIIESCYKTGYLSIIIILIQKQCDEEANKIISEMKIARNLDSVLSSVDRINRRSNDGSQKISQSSILGLKEFDTLLGELTLMSARGELYIRFLKRRVATDLEASCNNPSEVKEKFIIFEQLLGRSRVVSDLEVVIGTYTLLEKYYLNESFKKAVTMDKIDTSQLTSSIIDDSFYIMKKCVKRSIASCNVDGVCVMLNYCVDLLETQLLNIFHRNLRKGFPTQGYMDFSEAYSTIQMSLPSRKNASAETEDPRQTFMNALNNTASSIQNIKNLNKSLRETIESYFSDLSGTSLDKIHSCLDDLADVAKKFQNSVDFGISQLHTTAIKPKIKPWIDTLATISHDISEDEFTFYEANDPFIEPLIMQLDNLIASFSQCLIPDNYKILVASMVQEVTLQMEKTVLKCPMNRLGGLQFDKEIRSLNAYLSRISDWTTREKLLKINQTANLLNLESVSEVLEYATGSSWRLSATETRKVLQLRVDFKYEDVQRLRF